jgi:hypothetical protein
MGHTIKKFKKTVKNNDTFLIVKTMVEAEPS